MAVLVTGGCGYIGSATVALLKARGEEVVVVDNLHRGHRTAIDDDVPLYVGSVGDPELIGRIAREHAVDSCVHFAALAYVPESVREPALYFANNVQQGIALLDQLLQAGLRHVVFSSTCATYGEPQSLPMEETHPQSPENPYGWSKLFMERILSSYSVAYDLSFVALRYFNAAGATADHGEDHEPESHLVPNVLKVAAGTLPHLSVYGEDYDTPDGTAVRDYIHIADLANAHLRSLTYLRKGGASDFVNLGNGRGYSVLEVIETARRVTDTAIEYRMQDRRPGDASTLVACADKARELLGWTPGIPGLEEIVRSAWDWQRRHPDGYE